MFKQLFLDHPTTVDESYGEHFVFAIKFSGQLFLAAGAALVHAFVPAFFERTASRHIADMYARTHNRGR